MGEYQTKLNELTQDEVVSQLEGDGGLLALTRSELFFIGPDGAQRAALTDIKKVVGGKGGVLQIVGEAGPLIEAPVQAFQVDELRLFFESVKTYVARSQKQAAPPPAAPAEAAPEPEPEPVPPPPPPPPPFEEAEIAAPEPEKATSEPVTLDEEPDLPPPITPPEEPAPAAAVYDDLEEPAPAPAPVAPRRGNRVTGLLLKLTSLATLGLAGYWIYQNPMADVMQLGLVVVAGLGAALLEWHVSDI